MPNSYMVNHGIKELGPVVADSVKVETSLATRRPRLLFHRDGKVVADYPPEYGWRVILPSEIPDHMLATRVELIHNCLSQLHAEMYPVLEAIRTAENKEEPVNFHFVLQALVDIVASLAPLSQNDLS